MSRIQSAFVCQACGHSSPRWVGRCPNCGEWNTLVEERAASPRKGREGKRRDEGPHRGIVPIADVESGAEQRMSTGLPELDRVLGGGVVKGSVVLVGGDPGIGKSTLMLQMAASMAPAVVLYVTGEESAAQIRLRADRLGIARPEGLLVLADTDVDRVVSLLESAGPDIVIVDSVQTMATALLESAAGTVSQVREATAQFVRVAKSRMIPVFLIGHVTKEGVIAGPRVVEHMVDTVLQFEGDRHYAFRIVRALKNRFGSTNEIGIFEMHDGGLREVSNPSRVFLSERRAGNAGSVVTPCVEGTRPILVEVQALVTPTNYGMPQRNTTGIDARRLQMLLAVLEKRAGIQTGLVDVFVNVAGGIRIDEPSADLAVALAVVSSLRNIPVEHVAVGEVGLGGEIRTVHQMEKRIGEAAKLGFTRMLVPPGTGDAVRMPQGVCGWECHTVDDAIRELGGREG